MIFDCFTAYSIMLRRVLILFLVFCITGCARQACMIPEDFDVENRYDHSVGVKVEWFKKEGRQSSKSTPTLSIKKFTSALEESLRKSEVFARVAENSQSQYILKVKLRDITSPQLGLDMEVYLVSIWELTESDSNKVIGSDIVSSTYKARLCENLIGVLRSRLAIEGAIRENIKAGIIWLSRLDL